MKECGVRCKQKLTPGKSFKNDLRATLDLKQNSALHKKD